MQAFDSLALTNSTFALVSAAQMIDSSCARQRMLGKQRDAKSDKRESASAFQFLNTAVFGHPKTRENTNKIVRGVAVDICRRQPILDNQSHRKQFSYMNILQL